QPQRGEARQPDAGIDPGATAERVGDCRHDRARASIRDRRHVSSLLPAGPSLDLPEPSPGALSCAARGGLPVVGSPRSPLEGWSVTVAPEVVVMTTLRVPAGSHVGLVYEPPVGGAAGQ